MNAEQAAAVERLRGLEKGVWYAGMTEDMILVADLYLAEHPADEGEPVTEEWLRSVGFAKHEALWQWSKSNELKMPSRLVYWPGYRGDGTQWHIDGGPRAKDIYDIPEQPTRGSVRRLCSALGIELKEQP